LLIDDRAGSRELVRYPPLTDTAHLCRLDAGDVLITGNGPDDALLVGIEVKSIWDLLSSINTGRLQATQLPGMLAAYDINWLLYYGQYRAGTGGALEIPGRGRSTRVGKRKGKGAGAGKPLRTTSSTPRTTWRTLKLGKRPVPYGYLEGFLFDLAAMGVCVKHTRDVREAAVWLGCLERWWSKPWGKHKGMRTLDNSQGLSLMPGIDDDERLRAKVAAALPGIGFERAVAAAKYFGSVSALVNAGEREWAQVPGVGKVIAKAVTRAVRG
jgi:ERCC4-type nuclease